MLQCKGSSDHSDEISSSDDAYEEDALQPDGSDGNDIQN